MTEAAVIRDVAVFAEQLDTVFRIEVGEEEYVEATLVEAEPYHANSGNANSNSSFSLLFALPDDVTLEQRMYKTNQDQLGEMLLFLVPVGAGRMESVFN